MLVTFAAYWQVRTNGFINYDDPSYITENAHVSSGLTLQGVGWAFSSIQFCNWHPLTWLSHMLDCQLFGLNPAGHHLVNVLLHAVNGAVLYLLLNRLTRAQGPSALVAFLFALHPLHVESVAWASERKDTLSTLFFILTIWAYGAYVKNRRPGRYLLVMLFLSAGLMAKPMLVTLPFVLLLLDYWPLNRMAAHHEGGGVASANAPPLGLFAEKLPLLVIAAASSVTTFLVQQGGSAVWLNMPVGCRVANAVMAYATYVRKMIWPSDLALFYPHPASVGGISSGSVILSGAVLLAVCVMVFLLRKRSPYLLVGWLWYLGTLVPVIGLVQVGNQAMADRYSYIPLIGLFIMLAWGGYDLACRMGRPSVCRWIAVAMVGACAILTAHQVGYWKNTETVFHHALEVTPDNYLAHTNLGYCLGERGLHDEAMVHYLAAVQAAPGDPVSHNNIANALAEQGKIEESIAHYTIALKIDPTYADAHANLANRLAEKGFYKEAVAEYQTALRLKTRGTAKIHTNLGRALAASGQTSLATDHFKSAIILQPADPLPHYYLAMTCFVEGRIADAIVQYRESLRLRPDWPEALSGLAWILATQDKAQFRNPDEAVRAAERACRLTGFRQPVALDSLAAAYAAAGRFGEAVTTAIQAKSLAQASGQTELAKAIEFRIAIFKTSRPFYMISNACPHEGK